MSDMEPTDHPLAIKQGNGISAGRVAEICVDYEHREA
jgi:hypothetical protein